MDGALLDPALDRALGAIRPEEPPRAWSLIVTVLGDSAQGSPDVEIGAAALQAVLAPAGVAPQAMRTAIHRLKKDGWIRARRVGRSSAYSIAPHGRAEIARVSARIYAREGRAAADWHMLVAGPDGLPSCASRDSEARVAPGMAIRPGLPPAEPPEGCLALSGHAGPVPDWLRAALGPPELLRAYAALDRALAALSDALDGIAARPDATARAALRLLVVHEWRRLLLRHPDLPDHLFPEGWRAPSCRSRVAALLDRLPRPDLSELTGD